MEKASRKIISMPVYSINEGHYLGHVKSLVIDAEEKKLIALLVEQRLWGKDEKIVPFTKVQGIGEDVITIDKTLSLERSTNIPRILENLRRQIPVIGIKVMTDKGKTLGKIEEYYINTDNGEIVTLEISGSFFRNRLTLNRKNIITIAEAAIIVATQALSEMDEVETPVTETLSAAKGAATAVVAGTVKISQKISQGISGSINKYKSLQENQENQYPCESVATSPATRAAQASPLSDAETSSVQVEIAEQIEAVEEKAAVEETEVEAEAVAGAGTVTGAKTTAAFEGSGEEVKERAVEEEREDKEDKEDKALIEETEGAVAEEVAQPLAEDVAESPAATILPYVEEVADMLSEQ